MSYPAIVYNAMLSSPSDAEEERKTLRNCINRWNDVHSERNEMVLLPSDCENNVPSVSANIDDPRGQAVVNEYIVRPSDWLVVVFKNTFGSSTGKEESGTIEEIKLFTKTKPQNPISVYFFKDTLDAKVKQYKSEFRGFWKEYKDCQDLGKKFFAEISQVVYKNTCFQKNLVDSKRRVEERVQILITATASDTRNLISVSKLIGQEMQIEVNGCKYVGYEMALEHLYKKQWIESKDDKGEIFVLTALGKQEAETFKII